MKRDRTYYRAQYVPRAIGRTFDKLNRLLDEADELRINDVVTWRERADELRSRFLTDPAMVDAAWERAAADARAAAALKAKVEEYDDVGERVRAFYAAGGSCLEVRS